MKICSAHLWFQFGSRFGGGVSIRSFAVFAAVLALVPAAFAGQSCPVVIEKLVNHEHMTVNGLHAWADMRNASDKVVVAVEWEAGIMKPLRDPEYLPVMNEHFIKLKPGKSTKEAAPEGLSSAWIKKVQFADGTFWNDDGSHSCASPGAPAPASPAP